MTTSKARKLAAIMLVLGAVVLALGGVMLTVGVNSAGGSKQEITIEDYLAQGQKYYERGAYQEAILTYDKVLSIDEKNKDALHGLGQAYEGGSYYTDAEETYQLILDMDATDVNACLDLAELYMTRGKLEEARSLLETTLSSYQDEALMDLFFQTSVEMPEFTLAPGSYDTYQLLKLANQRPGVVVYYTTDGQEPTKNSPVFRDGIVLSAPLNEVRAIACNTLGYSSEPVSLTYEITAAAAEVAVNDPELERMLRELLGHSGNQPLYNYELAQIKELYITGSGRKTQATKDMHFYEDYAKVNGQRVYLDGTIYDISALSYCPFLESLNLTGQEALSLQGLEQLTQLRQLSLMHNRITDISLISGLTELTSLSLGWNEVSDISSLKDLTKLQTLGLWGNQISDISSLATLSNLYYLDVSDNQLTDISVVEQMPYLLELWIYGNQIKDLSAVNQLMDLRVFMMRGNPVVNYGNIKERAYDLKRTDMVE